MSPILICTVSIRNAPTTSSQILYEGVTTEMWVSVHALICEGMLKRVQKTIPLLSSLQSYRHKLLAKRVDILEKSTYYTRGITTITGVISFLSY